MTTRPPQSEQGSELICKFIKCKKGWKRVASEHKSFTCMTSVQMIPVLLLLPINYYHGYPASVSLGVISLRTLPRLERDFGSETNGATKINFHGQFNFLHRSFAPPRSAHAEWPILISPSPSVSTSGLLEANYFIIVPRAGQGVITMIRICCG